MEHHGVLRWEWNPSAAPSGSKSGNGLPAVGNENQPPAASEDIDSWMSEHRAIDVIIDISISRNAARYCRITSQAILIGYFDSEVVVELSFETLWLVLFRSYRSKVLLHKRALIIHMLI